MHEMMSRWLFLHNWRIDPDKPAYGTPRFKFIFVLKYL